MHGSDIKPANILVDRRGHLVLCDFGHAIAVPKHTPLDEIEDALHSSLSDETCGTAVYRAPEMLYGEDYNCQVDMWSIGVLILELWMGHVRSLVSVRVVSLCSSLVLVHVSERRS